ncbi:ATP-dependent helicase/nuclease subunit A [Zhongshania aliphaticivorans]|uniref:DNA 3'-5' helicase n=1 Tax=Zhongshania aliphaticivorans TaxID=1470434 RepID=A0A5S9PMB3_9GAMM|nr:UvrD-helicase domain-containing protein [Zhongshania aliphaticivorans]CAA0105249.1 ATP-dependent helicase/nuclease subunit A [Zhongshania aliphaticivorans]CAA0105524.1 ATP-dependent helicase/nuclease subunit A [Zhongshania aliphaticivorans]
MSQFSRPPDQDQRELAVNPRHSVLVRAPAGSGKTGVLLLRYLHCLLAVEQPETVVAITFTNKAAGEIKERVISALQAGAAALQGVAEGEALEPADSGFEHDIREAVFKVLAKDRANHWHLLNNSARLRITTFDSFCGSLVRRLPLLSGLGAAVPVTDADALYREAILSLFRQLDEPHCPPALATALQKLLAYGSNRIETLLPLLSALLAKRDQWLRDVISGDLDAMEEALITEVASSFEPAWSALQDLNIDQLIAGFTLSSASNEDHAWAADLRSSKELTIAEFDLVQTLAQAMLSGKGELYKPRSLNHAGLKSGQAGNAEAKAWLKGLEDDGLFEEASAHLACIASLPPPYFPETSRELVGHFRIALAYLLAHLRLSFEHKGGVDFGEIAQRAITALGAEHGEIVGEALLVEDRVQHILVDEMQDTSVSQIELLEALCQGWEDDDGRSVFFCGDVQQSIYAFRGSLVSLFDELQQRGNFAGKSLMPLQLKANFRSSPDLVNWVNDGFKILFTDRGRYYEPALPQRENPGKVHIHPQLLGQKVDAKLSAGQAEARAIVELIQQQQAAGINTGKTSSVAILVRNRGHLKHIVPALKAAGLTFSGQDIDSLTATPAVMDFMGLLRALWHEADNVAWARVLRAPFVGMSWDDLLVLRQAGGLLRDAIMNTDSSLSLSTEGQQALAHLRDTINWIESCPQSRDLRWALRSAWYLLGGPVCIESHQQSDIDRVLGLLDEYAPAGLLEDVRVLERAIERLYATPPSSHIELMTIHKSKGLEFDVVILPGTGAAGRNADRDLLAWQRLRGHMIFAPKPQRSGRDPGAEKLYNYMSERQAQALDEEVDRLIYVALTRAKRELHIFGKAQINSKGDVAATSGSILHRLWASVGDAFERAEPIETDDDTAPLRVPTAPRLRDFSVACNPVWQPPEPAESPLQRAQRQTENAVLEDNIEERAVGIVFHELMERLGRRNDRDQWLANNARLQAGITQRLRHHCHPEPALELSVARVMELVSNTLACRHGQWILDSYQWQASEQTIRRMIGGQWQTLILDRVFIDQGHCWIVDYKTAKAKGNLQRFLDEQAGRYHTKMRIYQQALHATGVECPITTALYFPAHQHLLVLDKA